MTISNGCFALLLAIGSDLNLYLIGSEIVRDDYVFDFTLLDIISGEKPKPLLSICAGRGEDGAFFLAALSGMNEMRRPRQSPRFSAPLRHLPVRARPSHI